ncbi:MAG: hypothetical protein LAN83_04245 [Acidobacteriia bacterium]|nr:hypothetical protein [Terriglobia bacterium]
MGEVYQARDTRLDRTVAIKVLPAHLSSNPDLRARIEREAGAISGLQHPNICVLYDVGRQDGVDFPDRVLQPAGHRILFCFPERHGVPPGHPGESRIGMARSDRQGTGALG